MMGDPLGSSRVSFQKQNKQNREDVVGAQSGQYRATVVERAWDVVGPGPGCDYSALPHNQCKYQLCLCKYKYIVV